jgi:DNA-binding MarR family transcriptional regulator
MPRPRQHADSRRAAEALLRAAPAITRLIERLLASHETPMTLAQYLTIQAIDDGDVVGAELARRAGVSPSAVSQVLAALEDEGLLTRMPHEGDRRRQPLVLTANGQTALRSVRRSLAERLQRLVKDMPSREADALARALERLDSTLGETPPPPRPRRPPPPRPHAKGRR